MTHLKQQKSFGFF